MCRPRIRPVASLKKGNTFWVQVEAGASHIVIPRWGKRSNLLVFTSRVVVHSDHNRGGAGGRGGQRYRVNTSEEDAGLNLGDPRA